MNKYKDISDLLFRLLFSSIFLGLGLEHIFADELIQKLMPEWMPYKRATSILCGLILVSGGACIVLGWQIRRAALLLSGFVITVTLLVHGPSLISQPEDLPEKWSWLWIILQRSNFVKNLCLLGVCLHLMHYVPGRFSLENWSQDNKS